MMMMMMMMMMHVRFVKAIGGDFLGMARHRVLHVSIRCERCDLRLDDNLALKASFQAKNSHEVIIFFDEKHATHLVGFLISGKFAWQHRK